MKRIAVILVGMLVVSGCGLLSRSEEITPGEAARMQRTYVEEVFTRADRYKPDYLGQATDEVSDGEFADDADLIEAVRTIYDVDIL